MKKTAVWVLCLIAFNVRGDFSQLEGKMKAGLYRTTVNMSIEGMEEFPQGVRMDPRITSRCFTREDVATGNPILNQNPRGKGSSDCQIQNFAVSGNSATYSISCPSQRTRLDGSITFTGNGYHGVNSGVMDQAGRPLKITLNFESKYVGACNK